MSKRIILGGAIGITIGFLVQAFGFVPLDSIIKALSKGSANFVTIAFAVSAGFVIICGIIGALLGYCIKQY